MKIKFYSLVILLVALFCVYFFVSHSFIIMSLAPVLGVLILVVVVAGGLLFLKAKA